MTKANFTADLAPTSRVAEWIKRAMRFIDLCEADPIDYLDQGLVVDAERLTKEGYELFGLVGEEADNSSLADLEHAQLVAVTAVRAPLASTPQMAQLAAALKLAKGHLEHQSNWITSKTVGYSFEALGEDIGEINAAIAYAELGSATEAHESTSDVVRRIVPAGHTCGPVMVGETEFADLEAAIAREKARLAAKLPTDLDAIAQINEAVRRLQELGWKDPVDCPKDGSTFDGIEVGSTGIHPYLYLGTWPDGAFWLQADGDLWPSRPILGRPRSAANPPDPRWTLGNGKPWTRDDSTTFDVLGLVGEIELEIPTRPEHAGTVFERLNAGRNVRRLTVEDIAAWSDDQVRDAELWAGAIHLNASDNDDVEIPPTPEHLLPWLERKAP